MSITEVIRGYAAPMEPIPPGLEAGGQLRAPVQTVLFDVYGTLLISHAGDIGAAHKDQRTAGQLKALLSAYGYKESGDRLIADFFRAVEAAHEEMRRQGIQCPEVMIEQVWQSVLGIRDADAARHFAAAFEMIVNPCYPMPHLEELFSSLREKGIRMGIISNAQFFTPLAFQVLCGGLPEELGFSQDLIFYSYRHGVAKPCRDLFRMAAAALEKPGIRTENTLYAGNDMRNDIMPAAAEGFQTALFAGDRRSLRTRADDTCCRGVQPDLVLTDWRQLLQHINE
ncbi:MAG: HAD family hydrolase [Desulfosalsimonadaceae bacterium]